MGGLWQLQRLLSIPLALLFANQFYYRNRRYTSVIAKKTEIQNNPYSNRPFHLHGKDANRAAAKVGFLSDYCPKIRQIPVLTPPFYPVKLIMLSRGG